MDTRVEFPQTELAVANRPAHMPRRWSGDRVTTVFTLALAFPLAGSIYERGGSLLPLLAGALIVAMGWTLLFTSLRGRAMNWHAVPAAVIFVLLVPPSVPLWQALLSLSFGVVVGEQVFGGRGYSFLHPAVAALAFLFFSFSATALDHVDSQLVSFAVLPAVVLLLASGMISWRILLATAIGLVGWMALKRLGLPNGEVLTSSLALGVVYLICEPTSAASTNAGRWAYGLLVGMLVVILGEAGQGIGSVGAVVFAALLGSVFAPLLDRIVVFVNVNRRRRRQWPISIR